MTGKTKSLFAALFGGIALSVLTAAAPAAQAQTAAAVACPCLTGGQVDGWFQAVQLPSQQQPTEVLACVDDPGFTTLDYMDKVAAKRAVYIDVTYPTSRKAGRCLVEVARAAQDISNIQLDLTAAQALACRLEVLKSQSWRALGCPNN